MIDLDIGRSLTASLSMLSTVNPAFRRQAPRVVVLPRLILLQLASESYCQCVSAPHSDAFQSEAERSWSLTGTCLASVLQTDWRHTPAEVCKRVALCTAATSVCLWFLGVEKLLCTPFSMRTHCLALRSKHCRICDVVSLKGAALQGREASQCLAASEPPQLKLPLMLRRASQWRFQLYTSMATPLPQNILSCTCFWWTAWRTCLTGGLAQVHRQVNSIPKHMQGRSLLLRQWLLLMRC